MLISQCIKDDFRGSMTNLITPMRVVEIMRTRFKGEISYCRAQKDHADVLKELHGDFDKSYTYLPVLCEMLIEKNLSNIFMIM